MQTVSAIISSAVHYPNISGFPLYPHTDGSKLSNRPSEWIAKSKTTFNSPTNIKAIYLSVGRATVYYWQPPISGGKRGLLYQSAKYDIQDRTAEGRLFGFLTYPYVLSNLEELWFDPVIFKSNALPQYKFIPGQVFGDSCPSLFRLLGETDRFPLLRAIVMFKGKPVIRSEHTSIIKEMETNKNGTLRRRVIAENLDYLRKTAVQTQSSYYVNVNLKADIQKFEIRDYVFDNEYLGKFRESLFAKYSNAGAFQDKTIPAQTIRTEQTQILTSKLETVLDEYIQNGASQRQLALVILAYAKDDSDGLKAEYARFSAEGRRKYGAVIEKAVV